MAQQLGRLGLDFQPSVGNFILVRIPPANGSAGNAQEFLRSRGVIVREMGAYKLEDWLRVSIGPKEGNSAFIAAIEEWLTRE